MTNGYFTLSTEAVLRENAFHLVVYVFTRTKVPVHNTVLRIYDTFKYKR